MLMEVVPSFESPPADVQPAWLAPSGPVALAGAEVHVWSAKLFRPDFDYSAALATLSATERERSALFHFERDRKNFIARRALLRGILGFYLNMAPSQVALACEGRGKPRLSMLDGPLPARLHFNFSQSRNLALLAVGRNSPLGVDVEKIRPMPEMEDIAATFCSVEENAQLRAAPTEQKLEVFFSIWTRKEAYLKGTGEGIAGALAELDCTEPPEPWSLHSLFPAAGFVGALAVAGGEPPPLCWQWPAP
jgi:4'-phosphopantetheinyl transferase